FNLLLIIMAKEQAEQTNVNSAPAPDAVTEPESNGQDASQKTLAEKISNARKKINNAVRAKIAADEELKYANNQYNGLTKKDTNPFNAIIRFPRETYKNWQNKTPTEKIAGTFGLLFILALVVGLVASFSLFGGPLAIMPVAAASIVVAVSSAVATVSMAGRYGAGANVENQMKEEAAFKQKLADEKEAEKQKQDQDFVQGVNQALISMHHKIAAQKRTLDEIKAAALQSPRGTENDGDRANPGQDSNRQIVGGHTARLETEPPRSQERS
ncbi:MAG: hypothetical protein AAF195_00700, partial [Pseudomonadota bacterium]